MIVSGLDFCCHCSNCFHTVLYTFSSYIIYSDALQENDYHSFWILHIKVYWFCILMSICITTVRETSSHKIQKKYLTLQTAWLHVNRFICFGGTNSLVWYTGIVLSLELTYNGARDLYASMEQQIQPLNFKSKLSLLPSLDNPVYYRKLNF